MSQQYWVATSAHINLRQCEKKRWEKLKVSASYMSSYSAVVVFPLSFIFLPFIVCNKKAQRTLFDEIR